MKLFDSHCHLDDKAYRKDIDRVIERARQNGITRMMTVGVNKKTAERALELTESNPDIYASVGFHPHDAAQCSAAKLDFLVAAAENPKVRAWGEIGLDYNRMYSPREDQEKWFVRQLQIAAELSLPVIFHERDTNGRFLEILKTDFKNESGGVVHCFSGTLSELEHYLDLGLHIGITCFAYGGDAAVFHTDVGFDDAPVVDYQRIRDDQVHHIRADRLGLPHAIPDHLTASELDFITVHREVFFHFDPQVRISQAYPVTGCLTKHFCIGLSTYFCHQ